MASKKSTHKPPKTRPASTFNAPVADGVVARTHLSAFSPRGTEYALVSLALDKPRVRVYDPATSRMLAEHTVDSGARVTCISWAALEGGDGEDGGPAKKRKKRNSTSASTHSSQDEQVLVLGLSSGATVIFSPRHGRVIRSLQHPTSVAAVTALGAAAGTLWVSTNDGTIRRWNLASGQEVGSWKRASAASFLLPRGDNELLECTHDARLLSFDDDEDEPEELAVLSGHASNIVDAVWVGDSRVATCADGDRVVHVWDVSSGSIVATLALDADALSVTSLESTLLARSGTGRAFIAPLPSSLPSKKAATLDVESTLSVTLKGSGDAKLTGATLKQDQPGRATIVRLAGGVRPIFETVSFLDDAGAFVPTVTVKQTDIGFLSAEESALHDVQRYREAPSIAGLAVPTADDTPAVQDGHLDPALAELSLGQRLGISTKQLASESDEDADSALGELSKGRHIKAHRVPQASGSLARTLVQALHASDSQLLDTVIRYGNDTRVVQATVRRLPSTLAVPFLTACTQRLGRRAQGAQVAGPQRGIVLLNWVRAVLVVHGAHLLTMPDLVSRLAALHGTLTTRSGMQDRLLALSGRLELALAQAELRTPATAKAKGGKGKDADPNKAGTRYVEGESDDEKMVDDEDQDDEDDDSIVDGAAESDVGSEEIVELGDDEMVSGSEDDEDGDEDEEDEDEDEDADDDDDDDDLPQTKRKGAFVDDEAEEWDDEESSEEE